MNHKKLSRIVIKGFKSIRECDLKLNDLNVLIGANGAGKSNFISFFRLVHNVLEGKGNLDFYVDKQGGPNALLYFGRKTTERLSAELHFSKYVYKFAMEPTQDNRMAFAGETFLTDKANAGHSETNIKSEKVRSVGYPLGVKRGEAPVQFLKNWRLYHFHDTSESALVKQRRTITDNFYLRSDASNLAAFLFLLKKKHQTHYERIVKTIQLVAPFFGDFQLRPHSDNENYIELEWIEKGEDMPFKAHVLSDGTLRFICLATALMQPEEFQPSLMLIDEPELGLHPYAIKLLASLLRSASMTSQIIISTQSTDFLDEFESQDIIVADRAEGTFLHRLDTEALQAWLEEYSLGELWQKNVLGARPSK
jgi:predicted ATPase